MSLFAQSDIKHDGKLTPAGSEVSPSDFGDAWDNLVTVGAISEQAPVPLVDEKPLSEMTKAELLAMAEGLGVEGASGMNKADLLGAVTEAQEG